MYNFSPNARKKISLRRLKQIYKRQY